jgi:UDP-N-acetylmuramate--alanine ligase
MSIRFESKRAIILDDYAHTPSEIEFSLTSVVNKYKDRRIIFVFEAHRYTRLKRDMKRFAQKLVSPLIDTLIIMPVYSAYEKEEPEVFEAFLGLLKEKKVDYLFKGSPENLAKSLFQKDSEDMAVLFTGAGKSSYYSKKVSEICTQKKDFFT